MTAVDCHELFKVHRSREGDAAALQGLTLSVPAGEALALLGPSGAGKSTLLRVLAGLETPSAGRAAVFGHDLSRAGTRRRARLRRELLGIVDQHAERALPPDLALRDAVALPLTLRGRSVREARRAADAQLDRVGLAARAAARPAELSGGERQRAAIAAATAHGPRLVLADEPTGELDAASADAVLALLRELTTVHGTTLLVVTHDPRTAAAMDRRVHLRDGRISDEDHEGRTAVVVDRAGWLRVPEDLLRRAGIADRALAGVEGGRVVLEPTDPRSPEPRPPQAQGPSAPPTAGDRPHGGTRVAVHGLRRAYGARAVLTGLDADLAAGTFHAVTGRSGSGKTTLLRIVAGLEPPDAGHVRLGDVEVTALDRTARAAIRASTVAYVAQGDVLLPDLGALEQPGVPADRLAPWLEHLGLGERARRPVGRLSGGERQRAAIARALASGRPLVILDEPTSRLDEAAATALGRLLRTVAREHGRTILAATHDPALVAHADRVLALEAPVGDGRA